MKFGVDDNSWDILRKLVLDPLKSYGSRVYLFGSRARGTYRKFSDVDLLIEANITNPVTLHQLYEIRSAIEDSRFPYKVDLVDSTELAESYRDQVHSEKIEL